MTASNLDKSFGKEETSIETRRKNSSVNASSVAKMGEVSEINESGMGLIEQSKKMAELKSENYHLKMQVFNLKKDLKKFHGISKEGNSIDSEQNLLMESKMFDPKYELLDTHKRMHEFNENDNDSSENDEYAHIEAKKILDGEINAYKQEITELKNQVSKMEQSQQDFDFIKNEHERLKQYEELPKLLKTIFKIPSGQLISISELQLLIESKFSQFNELKSISQLCVQFFNVLSENSTQITVLSKLPLDEILSQINNFVQENYDKSNFSALKNSLDILKDKICEQEENQKSLTQYPMENLKADITEVEAPSMMSKDFPISTPYVNKRVAKIQNEYSNFSSDMFKSVSNLKEELSLFCSTEYGSRLSANLLGNVSNMNTTNADITGGGVSAFFEKSDMQYANINTLLIRLEQLVDQNNQMQNEIVTKLDEYEKMENKLKLSMEEIAAKDDIINGLKSESEQFRQQISNLEEIAGKIQDILGCSSDELLDYVSKLREAVENMDSDLEEKCKEIDELNKIIFDLNENVSNLENANKNLIIDLESAQLQIKACDKSSDVDIKSTNQELSRNLSENISLLETVDFECWQKKYDELKQLTYPIFKNCEILQLALEKNVQNLVPNSGESKQTVQSNAAIQTSLEYFNNNLTSSNQEDVSIKSYQENISCLKNQICLLKSEISDANSQIEALKIQNSVPDSHKNDSKAFDLMEEMNKLRILLEKSYENNRSLRAYLNNIFSNKTPALIEPKSFDENVKTFTEQDIATTERSIQDCLALLRNMAKLIKTHETHPAYQDDSEESKLLKQNIYKSKKIMKVMQKNMLGMYKTIINSDALNKNALAKDSVITLNADSNDENKPAGSISDVSKNSKVDKQIVENSEKGPKIKEMINVFENRN